MRAPGKKTGLKKTKPKKPGSKQQDSKKPASKKQNKQQPTKQQPTKQQPAARSSLKNKPTRIAPSELSARLLARITLEPAADGHLEACFDGHAVGLGQVSAAAGHRAQGLRGGLPLTSFAAGGAVDQEIDRMVRRLARRGLLEYILGQASDGRDPVVIEPQTPDYWPQTPELGAADIVVLSRFAYLRRRGNDMVLESPRAAALIRIGDPQIAAAVAGLATPQPVKTLRQSDGALSDALLAVLLDCKMLLRIDAAHTDLRAAEGGDDLEMWDFHDLVFHTRSTEGRQANPLGGLYPYAGILPPLPAVRPRWPGQAIDLQQFSGAPAQPLAPVARLLRARQSTRSFDDAQPITLGELSRFLDGAARVQSQWESPVDFGDGDSGPMVGYAPRPYPSGGAAYALELYLTVANCDGLAPGFYHYDAAAHALVLIESRAVARDALLTSAAYAMDAPAGPQILITIAARFGRTAWKYSAIAYALVLKEVGVLTQSLYLVATDMGLGGCAIGNSNIDLFAKMTGIDVHVEGPVGQFALGRGAPEAFDEGMSQPE